jgi:16S rRNA processing protein RimM
MTTVTLRRGSEERVFPVEKVEQGGPTLYMKLSGIDSPEAARCYNGWEVLVPREAASPLREGEVYVDDLKGCALRYTHGHVDARIGCVTAVIDNGTGCLLEAALTAEGVPLGLEWTTKAGTPRTVLVPYKDEFIGAVDVTAKTIELRVLWILE